MPAESHGSPRGPQSGRRTAVVTGGSGGIGSAVSAKLASEGNHVWIADMDLARARTATERIIAEGGSAQAVSIDVADEDSVARAFDQITAASSTIDILVNSAGMISTHAFERIPVAVWERTYRINVIGMYLCIQVALPFLRAAPAPARIVNVASGAGKTPGVFTAPYHASKAAVISLTRTAALALAPDILVNSVCPGVIDTAMWEGIDAGLADMEAPDNARFTGRSMAVPLKRPGSAEEVADLIVFLTNDASKYITGEDINISGGSVMH